MEECFFRLVIKDFLSLKLDIENRTCFDPPKGKCVHMYPLWWSCSIGGKKKKKKGQTAPQTTPHGGWFSESLCFFL